MGQSLTTAPYDRRIAAAARGDVAACFELGITFSTGTADVAIDMIEAHKWFNLAAMRGDSEAQQCRAEVAEELTGREIATAQRAARAFLAMNAAAERRAA